MGYDAFSKETQHNKFALLPSASHLTEIGVRNVWSDHTQNATFADLQLHLTRLLFWFTEKNECDYAGHDARHTVETQNTAGGSDFVTFPSK